MERRGQIERPFVPVNQNHQSRIQYQMSIGTGASAINLTTASEVTLRRTRSQEGNLDVVTFETFKPKLKEKRSISWSTAWETSTVAASRSVDRELSQIYDTVKPLATNARDERAMGFSKLSHPGYPIRELLPSMYTDAPSSLMLYASLHADNDHHGSTYDVPRRAALAYSVPDVKKRREKEQESKKQSYNTTVNPEEMSMFNDFNGHYDTPKCKYTVDKETTANSNISSLYDQPRFVKPNFGFNYKSPTGKEKSEKFEK